MKLRIGVLVGILVVLLTGSALGQAEVDANRIKDIILEGNNGGFHLIFYNSGRNACITSGSVSFYKKAVKLKDVPKMEGRGINQQIVMERNTYEEYEPVMKKTFKASDFRRVKTGIGEGAMALPVKLPGVTRGDQIRIKFGNVRKDIVVGYFH